MDKRGQRLVARLRHQNPSLTITEFHIESINPNKKAKIIEFLRSLELRPDVDSTSGMETVVSVDITSNEEQSGLYDKVVKYLYELGLGDISMMSEPFNEKQPEIESDSFFITSSLSRDYTALSSRDIQDILGRNGSDSEFELILSQPGQSTSTRLPKQHSSKDVIGRLNTKEGKPKVEEPKKKNVDTEAQTSELSERRKPNFWSRAKNVFKRRKVHSNHTVQYCQVELPKDFPQKSPNYPKLSCYSRGDNVSWKGEPRRKNSLFTLQSRLERVSQQLFKMEPIVSKTRTNKLFLDAWTQTDPSRLLMPRPFESSMKTLYKNNDKVSSSKLLIWKKSKVCRPSVVSTIVTVSSDDPMSEPRTGRRRTSSVVQGRHNPEYLKQPTVYNLCPVKYAQGSKKYILNMRTSRSSFEGSRFFNSESTTSSTYLSFSSINRNTGRPSSSMLKIHKEVSQTVSTFTNKGPPNISCSQSNMDYSSVSDSSPFVSSVMKNISEKIQTENVDLTEADTNTSTLFFVPKLTQTVNNEKISLIHPNFWTQAAGTQTGSCSMSTSCSELLNTKACETDEDTEAVSEKKVFKCDSCILNSRRRRKWHTGHKMKVLQKASRLGLTWEKLPDGRLGVGYKNPDGRVIPVNEIVPHRTLPRICRFFGGQSKAIRDELDRQNLELVQMKMILLAINDEILRSEGSSSSSDEDYPSSYQKIPNPKKVTFSEPLVQECEDNEE